MKIIKNLILSGLLIASVNLSLQASDNDLKNIVDQAESSVQTSQETPVKEESVSFISKVMALLASLGSYLDQHPIYTAEEQAKIDKEWDRSTKITPEDRLYWRTQEYKQALKESEQTIDKLYYSQYPVDSAANIEEHINAFKKELDASHNKQKAQKDFKRDKANEPSHTRKYESEDE
jgi:hypothetical protein